MQYKTLDYRGIDYSQAVWHNIHRDIKEFESDEMHIRFFYDDICNIITEIVKGDWTPDLVVFQYVLSDMHKHSGVHATQSFLDKFAEYYNSKLAPSTYVVLNDVNLSTSYGGGREYFDYLYNKLSNSAMAKGRFCNDNATSPYNPRGYTYGEESRGEFRSNKNFFDLQSLYRYSPFKTCASAQMWIRKK